MRKFRPYLEGYKFKVVRDHTASKWLHNLKSSTDSLARWTPELIEYDYEIFYRKCSANLVLDALSRINEMEKSVVFILANSIERKAKNS